MNKTKLTLMIAVLAGACAVEEAPSSGSDPRQGFYTVHSELDGDAISSEVYRDGVLVAVATVDAEAAVVALVDSGKELVTAPPADYDPRAELERYHDTIINMSTGLELAEADDATEFRNAGECGYVMWDGGNGNFCAYSWCGASCWAYDCDGLHVISGCD